MLALLGAQLLTGLTTIFFQWPLLIAVLRGGRPDAGGGIDGASVHRRTGLRGYGPTARV